MSAEFGSLVEDRAFRDSDAGPSDGPVVEREQEAGAWPEDLDTRFYAESSVTLPGMSEPGQNCGTWQPQEFCDACGEPSFGPSQCEQRGCPNCWWKWSGNRAVNMTVRLAAARHVGHWGVEETENIRCEAVEHRIGECEDCRTVKVRCDELGEEGHRVRECRRCTTAKVRCRVHFEAEGHRIEDCDVCQTVSRSVEGPDKDWMKKRAVHTVASPPEGEIQTLDDVQQGFGEAYELAQERGVRGGVALFHGFRVLDEVKREFREEEPDGGIWAWIREREESWRTLTYWSPHYHIVGLAQDIEADTGDSGDVWRFRRVRSLERFEMTEKDGYDDMVGLSRYLLSHLTFESGESTDSVRWFGTLASSNFSPEEALSEDELGQIEQYVEEVVGRGDDRADDGDQESCECEECGSSSMSPIWEAGSALLDQAWCERIGREQHRRLSVAFEWAKGDRQPPPGLKRPATEEECRETFEAML